MKGVRGLVKTKIEKAAFIGLGVMGYPMAGHLAKSGFSVMVYNRTKSKADRWVSEFGGRAAATPREAASGADIVFLCVGNDNDVRSVVYGEDGALAGMTPGAILWDDTTDSAQLARELYKAAKEKGVSFIDAPVSGGQSGAEKGVLTVMCGGDEEAFEAGKNRGCRLLLRGDPDWGSRGRTAREDGESDLHCRNRFRAFRKAAAFGRTPVSIWIRCSAFWEKGCCGVPGRWQTAERPWFAISLILGLPSTG